MSARTAVVLRHLYRRPGDLLPYCGAVPGPNDLTGDWHTGHDRELLLECSRFSLVCCVTCLMPEALGGITPLILSDEDGRDIELGDA